MISIVICALVFLIGILFRIAGATRLVLPLMYCFAVAFFLPGWNTEHPVFSAGILYALIGLVVLSWVITLIRKISEHRAKKEIERWEEEEELRQLIAKQGYYKPE